MQIVFYLFGLTAVFLIFRQRRYSSKIISAILGGFWLWMGTVYHWIFFTEINPAAHIFAATFVLQGILIIYYGLIRGKLEFNFDKGIREYMGLGLIASGILIYPIVGYIIGHRFPDNPTFGLPCPTTMFTLGVLLLGSNHIKRLIVIPFIWSIVGFMAAVSFGIKEDVLLLLSGIIALVVILFFKRKNVDEHQAVTL
ncbi:MAG: hypothetical protein UT43_C0006G0019 [Parcubacteria group bacterium GW2011_GWC1_39_29]|nr:MAG: hypothetical protein UT43_C0006G0019 [Parcubacteria group bacterium GW2011_GWC1_39_29]